MVRSIHCRASVIGVFACAFDACGMERWRDGARTPRRRTMKPSSPRRTAATPTGKPISAGSPPRCSPSPASRPGMKVLDMEANAGYSTELLARAVGPDGVVYAQDSAAVMERFVKDKFDIRAQKPAMKNVVHVVRNFDDPIPPDVSGPRPDHVLLCLSRRDLHAGRSRRDEREDVRGAQARRLSGHRRPFRKARRRHDRRQDAASHRGKHAAPGNRGRRVQARGRRRFPASSRRSAGTRRCSIRRCRSTSSC